MPTYRFEIQSKPDGRPDLFDEPHELECESNLDAIRMAQLLLKRVLPGYSARLLDPSGMLIWMDVADE